MKRNVLEFLEETAGNYPDKVFVADEQKSVTFLEAEAIAKGIGSYLEKHVSGKRKPIGVLIGRDVESILMFLGVAYSGNFYVPLNPELPEKRLQSMMESIGMQDVLGKEKDSDAVRSFSVAFHAYGKITSEGQNVDALGRIRSCAIDTDPLYAMFTSGSTGMPKAVMISHRGIIDLVEAFDESFHLNEDKVFGNQASLDFDISVKDIYCALRCGGRVEVIPKRLFSFPVQLIEYINERKVNHAFWAVAALSIIANLNGMKKVHPNFLDAIMFSGEAISVKTLTYWQEHLPHACFYNLYGPTEITCNCTYFPIERRYAPEEKIPIGKPFRNTDVLLLDGEKEAKAGEIGELCVRGTCLALGYCNSPEKTAEKFVQNPMNPFFPEILYRTGDLARYDDSGNLVYCGRKDYQVKHMGYRIELGDIEAAADAIESIGRSCCLYDREQDKIVLFYEAGRKIDKEIREALKARLPQYMMPNRYVQLPVFPANYHGKIDRKRLEEEFVGKA